MPDSLGDDFAVVDDAKFVASVADADEDDGAEGTVGGSIFSTDAFAEFPESLVCC